MKLGMTMRGVSELLGPPDWWTDGGSGAPVPVLWRYRNYLEVFFEVDEPYRVYLIKVPNLPPAGKKYVEIYWGLRLMPEKISNETGLSDLLRMPIWAPDEKVVVGICHSWNPVIDICTDKVRLVWSMSIVGEEIVQSEAANGRSRARSIAKRDELSTGFLGIYSGFDPKADRAPLDGWEDFSAQDYLALVSKFEESTVTKGS
ncbi:hypothetical protein F4V91_04855 [Neorhizobium galegae]|uniref:Uncharacterized protein n=1 Tax=Neorhizobium galegae TaxID=399 RepID=A0A6A1TNM0_NEOGA|nr:hypothetical protein [Neorhizobium galegae]KAB1085820.1 hypothetical protein F4V91_04855 [Neorhizobium galegae]